MEIKNVSKKVIGNQSFRLLPGKTMIVNGDEVWVKNYLDSGKLEVIEKQAATETAESCAGEVGKNQENAEQAEPADEKAAEQQTGESEPKKPAGRQKNSGLR